MARKWLGLFLFLLWVGMALGQDKAFINGAVKDLNGKPIELVNVVVKEDQNFSTTTNDVGFYSMPIPAGKQVTIIYSYLTKQLYSKTISLKKNETLQISFQVEAPVTELREVEVKDQSARRQASLSEIKVRDILLPDAGGGGIEAYLVSQALGINKSNELSSNYSVRGGNYDENLVYVNDFEIYRPFLIRSGQQEGLSFANPNLVSTIKFSSGGFQARYGDKLSSVLDVTYKRPKQWGGSISASLLGFAGHLEGCSKDKRFTFLLGVRQKTSQYILKSLETQGEYSPNFIDAQLFASFQVNEKWRVELISNVARNQFVFRPDTRTTKFGTITDVKQLEMAFEGQEIDNYLAIMNGLSLVFTPKENLQLKLLGSAYNNSEKETFDILADYRIGDVETDQSKSDYGKVKQYRGIGGLQNWGRNTLFTDIYLAAFRGSWLKKGHQLQWGVDYKHEILSDKLSEWDMLDSAGYSLPFTSTGQKNFYGDSVPLNNFSEVNLSRSLKTRFQLSSNRISAYIQDSWRFGDSSKYNLTYGVRFQYWDVNKEPVITPRIQFSVKPSARRDLIVNLSAGMYYQPPFYREMRDLNGHVNTGLRAQKSVHAVAGLNYTFKAWRRPFQFVTEVYYKYLWDIVPYEFDNTLIRYYGRNMAHGHAFGADFRLGGELAEGAESWISLGLLRTINDIDGDMQKYYVDSAGNRSIYNTNGKAVDTVTQAVGYVPRPTDQWVTFNLFFQDYIPKWPFLKLNINLVFGSGIPVKGPTDASFSDSRRLPFYRRVDLGFAAQLWNPKWDKKKTKVGQGIKSVWFSLDVLNVFGINNTVSYLWIKDYLNQSYSVPNYLPQRRVNAKLVFNF
ncbi:MAG: carboxypeptidase-like regulatory domain-containing protein [Chitinophagales bacterium]